MNRNNNTTTGNGKNFLIAGGCMSIATGLLHFAIVWAGASGYRYFGAGEDMALMAESGSAYPALLTAAIAFVFLGWGVYAFSAAGLVRKLPFQTVLIPVIGAVFALRLGVLPQIVIYLMPGTEIMMKDIVFSVAALTIGVFYLVGWKLQRVRALETKG
ncbi:MAG: hypothetical protein HYV28_01080 [Ignavibacteriales bacterium]|nr:hypothetical protein [Ignavibacteriales bacterium]